jgi:hypothetical protein
VGLFAVIMTATPGATRTHPVVDSRGVLLVRSEAFRATGATIRTS